MTGTTRTVGVVLGILWLAACGGGGGGSGGPAGPANPEPAAATLSQVTDCDALNEAIRTDARRKIAVQADELRAQGWIFSGGGEPTPVFTATPAAMPTPAAGGEGPPENPERPATDTNVQVPGVDEADVIETDGDRIYLLHESSLVILRAVPPAETALVEQVPIEGWPLGMFVADGRALVLSDVYDGDGALGGADRCDVIGGPFPVQRPDGLAIGAPELAPVCPSSFVKLTLLDLTGDAARVTRELYVEGRYIGARRHGTRARAIVQRDWGLPPGVPEPWQVLWNPWPTSEQELLGRIDAWEQAALTAIDAGTLADWLPARRERVGGALVDRPLACSDAFATEAGVAPQGTSVIVGLDIATDDAPLADTVLMGHASLVYANGETLVLTNPEWQQTPMDSADSRTAVHVFTLPADSFTSRYEGSGFVPGTLLSQFAIDVQDAVVRVATTFTRDDFQTATRVITARIENGALAVLGSSPDLAPGERLFGARFLGDRAYLVTFRQIDPLFVVDLQDPAHPTVLGEVELPGFSTYLHPLDATHLLTLGQAATPEGQLLGAAVRIFDVADPTAPRLTAEHVLANDGWTLAASNHLAFIFDTRLGLLALPFDRWDFMGPSATLALLNVDVSAGISLRGEIDHEGGLEPCPLPFHDQLCSTYDQMLRGLFIADAVYSISTNRVEVHALDDLETPLASVVLP